MKFFNFFQEIGLTGVIDITFMTIIIYGLLVGFKRTKASFVFTGIIILAGVYLFARELNLALTAAVFQGFFAIILIVMIVIFQEELKYLFEKIAVWSLNRKSSYPLFTPYPEVEILVRTLNDFTQKRIGALIVIQGRDLLLRHLHRGIELQGNLSEPLLKSIFDPNSPGHDGAVIIERNKVSWFSCQLPLSKNFKVLGNTGTRHAAGLGLSELTDALCIIVSEERGTITLARRGVFEVINDTETLSRIIKDFYQEISPLPENRFWAEIFKKNSLEKIIAVALTLALWFVLVYGSKLVYKTYTVPIRYSALPPGLMVERITPGEVEVSFSGPRRAFYFFSKQKIKIFLKFWKLKEGRHKIKISRSDLSFPKGIVLENLDPPTVRVIIKKIALEEKGG
ncbi:MAG: diadenylate cyclase [Desulfobacterota bacterium]|nr:diadenylate cyclase [Thermodesulfobacteriota bacterium]